MSIFKGAAVAMITPMTETQEVNYEKLGAPCPMRSIWMPSNIPWKK